MATEMTPGSTTAAAAPDRSVARGERLYKQAMAQRDRIAEKRAAKEKEYSFTPTRVAHSKRFANVTPRYLAKRTPPKQQEAPSFHPTLVTRKTNKRRLRRRRSAPGAVFEQLYKAGQQSAAKLAERTAAAEVAATPSFMPHTNGRSPASRAKLYSPEAIKSAQEAREKERQQRELAECTFHPAVTASPSRPRSNEPIHDRLFKEAQKNQERLAKFEKLREERDLAACTFRPSLKASSAAANRRQPNESEGAWFTRLYRQAAEAQRARQIEASMTDVALKHTFRPTVHGLPNGAPAPRRGDADAPTHERLFRLHTKAMDAKLKATSAASNGTSSQPVDWELALRSEGEARATSPARTAGVAGAGAGAAARLYEDAKKKQAASSKREARLSTAAASAQWAQGLRHVRARSTSPQRTTTDAATTAADDDTTATAAVEEAL